MSVIILSDTAQKFDGKTYYKCGNYYQRKGKRLHRVVWEYYNGAIPDGWHVHHINGDRSDNRIENLALMKEREHLSLHMSKPERKAESRESVKKAIAAAPEWHGSAEGKVWHSAHAKEMWESKPAHERRCAWCGAVYTTRDLGHNAQDTYCCLNHKAAALRWRRKHEGQTNYPGRAG